MGIHNMSHPDLRPQCMGLYAWDVYTSPPRVLCVKLERLLVLGLGLPMDHTTRLIHQLSGRSSCFLCGRRGPLPPLLQRAASTARYRQLHENPRLFLYCAHAPESTRHCATRSEFLNHGILRPLVQVEPLSLRETSASLSGQRYSHCPSPSLVGCGPP